MSAITHKSVTKDEIEQAINQAIQGYFESCRARIPAFIDRHFHYPGAVDTNRVAFGWDMLRAPINLFWAPVYALVCAIKFFVHKTTRLDGLYCLLDRIPAGFTTEVQQHLSQLITRDLLGQGQPNNSLEAAIVESLQGVYESHAGHRIDSGQFQALLEPLIAKTLMQYQITRTASADITNSLSCTIFGVFAFQKFTPGGIGLAIVLASLLAKTLATRDFILGETLGHLYYSWFPPTPSLGVTIGAMVVVLTVLAAFAALSGVITDPAQAAVGLHRRRLHKMLDHLQQDFLSKSHGSFRPKDQFVARILDAFDMIKSGLI